MAIVWVPIWKRCSKMPEPANPIRPTQEALDAGLKHAWIPGFGGSDTHVAVDLVGRQDNDSSGGMLDVGTSVSRSSDTTQLDYIEHIGFSWYIGGFGGGPHTRHINVSDDPSSEQWWQGGENQGDCKFTIYVEALGVVGAIGQWDSPVGCQASSVGWVIEYENEFWCHWSGPDTGNRGNSGRKTVPNIEEHPQVLIYVWDDTRGIARYGARTLDTGEVFSDSDTWTAGDAIAQAANDVAIGNLAGTASDSWPGWVGAFLMFHEGDNGCVFEPVIDGGERWWHFFEELTFVPINFGTAAGGTITERTLIEAIDVSTLIGMGREWNNFGTDAAAIADVTGVGRERQQTMGDQLSLTDNPLVGREWTRVFEEGMDVSSAVAVARHFSKLLSSYPDVTDSLSQDHLQRAGRTLQDGITVNDLLLIAREASRTLASTIDPITDSIVAQVVVETVRVLTSELDASDQMLVFRHLSRLVLNALVVQDQIGTARDTTRHQADAIDVQTLIALQRERSRILTDAMALLDTIEREITVAPISALRSSVDITDQLDVYRELFRLLPQSVTIEDIVRIEKSGVFALSGPALLEVIRVFHAVVRIQHHIDGEVDIVKAPSSGKVDLQ